MRAVVAVLAATGAAALTATAAPPTSTRPVLASLEVTRRKPSTLPDRRPVVILHGLLGQKRNFRSWAAGLAEALSHKRRVVALDLRGHGDSPAGPLDYAEMAADVLATLDASRRRRLHTAPAPSRCGVFVRNVTRA